METMAKDVGIDTMPKYLQVTASILQDKLQEFIKSAGTGEPVGSLKPPTGPLKRILDRASQLLVAPGVDHASNSRGETSKRIAIEGSQICKHSCEYHEELMDPSLWGTLPEPVLYGIFARLPLPKIISLQVLSKKWKKEMRDIHRDSDGNIVQSEFLKMCEAVHQKVALITRDRENMFWVRLLDIRSNQWHTFQISAGEPDAADITAASENGGLVCFVSTLKTLKTSKMKTFVVDVVNPLTKSSIMLPPLPHMNFVNIVQIVLDPETQNFKVLVTGGDASSGEMVAQVYDQDTGAWSNALTWAPEKKMSMGFIFSNAYHWGNFRYAQKRDNPCVYDFTAKSIRLLKDCPSLSKGQLSCPLISSGVKSLAQLEDHVFVLQRDKFGPASASASSSSRFNRPGGSGAAYYIVEYRIRPKGKTWVKIKVHACNPFETPPKAKYDLSLFACKGYLMVFARLPEEEPYKNEVAWLYRLADCKWFDLPKLPGDKPYDIHDLMCAVHWNTFW